MNSIPGNLNDKNKSKNYLIERFIHKPGFIAHLQPLEISLNFMSFQ